MMDCNVLRFCLQDDICRRVQSSQGVPLVLVLLSAAVDTNDPSLAAAAAALLAQASQQKQRSKQESS